MAEAAARRREARKRKLLMSSEDRLNRILQLNAQAKEELETQPEVPDIHDKEDIVEPQTSPDQQTRTLTQESPDAEVESAIQASSEVESTIQASSEVESTTQASSEVEPTTQASCEKPEQGQDGAKIENDGETSAIGKAESSSSAGSPAPEVDLQEIREKNYSLSKEYAEQHDVPEDIPKSSSPTLTRRSQARTTTKTQESSHQDLSPTLTQDAKTSVTKTTKAGGQQQLVSVREVLCILFAVMMRCMLTYDWFVQAAGQSIILPFLLLQLTLQALTSKQLKAEKSGGMIFKVLSMALMLGSVPPETVSRFKRAMAVFATVLADFTLYLFTFNTCHCLLEVFS